MFPPEEIGTYAEEFHKKLSFLGFETVNTNSGITFVKHPVDKETYSKKEVENMVRTIGVIIEEICSHYDITPKKYPDEPVIMF